MGRFEVNKSLIKKVLKLKSQGGTYRYDINYDLLDKDGKVLLERRSEICYGRLPGELLKFKDTVAAVRLTVSPAPNFENTELMEWLEECIAAGALIYKSDEVSAPDILANGIVMHLDHPMMSEDRFYVAASLLRAPREYPNFVKNTMRLIKYGAIPFWAAVYFCHGHNVSATGHMFLTFNDSQYVSPHAKQVKTSIDGMRSFVRLMKSDKKMKPLLKDLKNKGFHWDVFQHLTPKEVGRQVEQAKLAYPQIREILETNDDDHINALIKEMAETSHA